MLGHQGFGDAAAGGVNLGRETTALYLHMHDHGPLSPLPRVVACCAEADPVPVDHCAAASGAQFAASCFTSVRFAVSQVCSGSFLASGDLHRLQRAFGAHGCRYRVPRCAAPQPVKASFNRCLFLLLFNIVLKILGKTVGQETKLRNAMIVNENRTIIYKW